LLLSREPHKYAAKREKDRERERERERKRWSRDKGEALDTVSSRRRRRSLCLLAPEVRLSFVFSGFSSFEIWNKITSAQGATSIEFFHCKKHSIGGFLCTQISLSALS
jgi:hypothetical protein